MLLDDKASTEATVPLLFSSEGSWVVSGTGTHVVKIKGRLQ
jgi:hypothetical protein